MRRAPNGIRWTALDVVQVQIKVTANTTAALSTAGSGSASNAYCSQTTNT